MGYSIQQIITKQSGNLAESTPYRDHAKRSAVEAASEVNGARSCNSIFRQFQGEVSFYFSA